MTGHEHRAHLGARHDGAPGLVRSAAALGLTGATTVLLASLVARLAGGRSQLDTWVALGVLGVGTVAAAVLTVGSLLLLTSALVRAAGRSSRLLERATRAVTPAVLRRAVAVTISAGVGLGVASPAVADEVDLGWSPTTSTVTSVEAPAATPVPTTTPSARPTTPPTAPSPPSAHPTSASASNPRASLGATGPSQASADVATALGPRPSSGAGQDRTGAPADGTVVVRGGDSLWSIAAAHLPVGADEAEVAAAWPRWYAANRDAIGPDPDLIHPGLELRDPGTRAVTKEDA